MATSQLHMQTLFRFDDEGRIAGTREPDGERGPVFWLARGIDVCAWAVRRGTPEPLARELAKLRIFDDRLIELALARLATC